MADTAVTERRIRPIQDAINAGNWKQALKECEKWQKKGENSDRFLALKAAVLLHQVDDKSVQQGASETLQLCRRGNPVLHIEAIHQLQASLSVLKLDADEGPKLWQRAVAARASDKELITTWLTNSIAVSDWQSAQKATMALKKAFPRDREYDYWNIAMCFFIHGDERLPEKERTLFGMLANRMITKAAQTGPADRMIANPEELSLLAAILTKTGSVLELTSLLTSEGLKAVADQDRPHANTLFLQAVSLIEDPTEVQRAVIAFYRGDEGRMAATEDDRFWYLLVKSATTSEGRQRCTRIIDGVLEKQPGHRQALLATIDLRTGDCDGELVPACLTYYHQYATKAFCFDDLARRLRTQGQATVRSFGQKVAEHQTDASTPAEKMFALKLDYHQLVSGEHLQEHALSFATKALRLYAAAEELEIVAGEAALLAALALLQRAYKCGSSADTWPASMILHSACVRYPDYYPLRVLLLQVQQMSGQLRLSMAHFHRLSVKNLQWETAGHLLLERIATLHPHQYGQGDEALNPLGAIDAAITVSQNSRRSLDRAIRDGLTQGSYSNLVDTVDLRKRLQTSMCRQLYTIEERKIHRALDRGLAARFEPYAGELVDLRDTSFMPAYGLDDGDLQTSLRTGPRPCRGWIDAMTLHECLVTYLTPQLRSLPPGGMNTALEDLNKALARVSPQAADLTKAERHATVAYRVLAHMALQTSKAAADTTAAIAALQSELEQLAHETAAPSVGGTAYPDAKWLHRRFVRLEVLHTIAHFAAFITGKSKSSKDKKGVPEALKGALERLRPEIDQQAANIYSEVRKMKDGLSAQGVLGQLVDAALGRKDEVSAAEQLLSEQLSSLQNQAAVEEYCGAIRDSWEDALDGILAVKIKTV